MKFKYIFKTLGVIGIGIAFINPSQMQAVPRIPDGLLVRATGQQKVYYVQDDKRHYIESPRLLKSRFDWGSVTITTKQDINDLPKGDPLKFREGSLLAHDGSVYVISDGKRRPINTAKAFDELGYSWSNVVKVSESELKLHPKGDKLYTDSSLPDGTLIQDPKGQVFFLDDGKRRYIPSPLIFQARFEWKDVIEVSKEERNAYPKGDHLVYPDGLLISSDDGVFLMQDGKRLPITSPRIFQSYGLHWEDVREATPYELSLIPKGDQFKQLKKYPDTSVVRSAKEPKVYQFDDGVLKHVETPKVLKSYGNTFDDVLVLPDNVVQGYTKKGDIGFRNETLIRKGSDRYYIQDGKKRPIDKSLYESLCESKTCFEVTSSELDLHKTGEKYAPLNVASLDGYEIPAKKGKTAREQHLVRKCNETIQEHYQTANTGEEPGWLRNGFPRLDDGRGLGGAFAERCEGDSPRHYSAVEAPMKAEKYYITMRWNYLEWYEATTTLTQKLEKDDTTIKVKDASKWKYPDKEAGARFTKTGYIRINDEIIAYKRKDENTLKVEGGVEDGRGYKDDGKAQSHEKGSTVTYVYNWRDSYWKAYPWTAYLDGESDKTDKAMKWHKQKKVLVTNPENGKRIVASILEAGPAMWTDRVSGLSPEAMKALDADIDQKLKYGFLSNQDIEPGPLSDEEEEKLTD